MDVCVCEGFFYDLLKATLQCSLLELSVCLLFFLVIKSTQNTHKALFESGKLFYLFNS